VTDAGRRYVVRLPRDPAHLASLRQEARVAAALQGRVDLRLPDTRVVEGLAGRPAFAIHTLIAGEPLTTAHYAASSPAVRERLVADLAHFFRQMHAIPLEQACGWLGIPCQTGGPAAERAPRLGKPRWFDADAVAELRSGLVAVLDEQTRSVFEQTVACFQGLASKPEYLVFGHGDLHGYNAAVARDELGPRLAGAFDLENTGILDLHEDFFRLSLVSEPMLEDVLRAYQDLPGPLRSIDRARIAVYFRAFLFHLMVGKTGPRLAHLHRLLQDHLAYYRTNHGRLAGQ
jgi:aminoglycoside phosphotransferase (APT) family kinase protein